jgi:hypothetical protein
MSSAPFSESAQHAAMERDTLRLLCSVLIKPGTRVEICRLLHPGVFLDGLRRTVFEEILALGAIQSNRLRELLPARVTNRGFPEFDLDELLQPKLATEAEIEKLFESALQLLKVGRPADAPLFDLENDA